MSSRRFQRQRQCWKLLAMAVGIASMWSTVAFAQCTKDTDCKGDRICLKGSCTEPKVAPPAKAPEPALLSQDQILAKYEDGDVDGARVEAERAGLTDLAEKFRTFAKLFTAATASRDSGPQSIGDHEAALVADSAITTRPSKYAKTIRKRLSKLWLAKAEREPTNDAAKESLAKSLTYNPANEEASARLAELNAAHARAEDVNVGSRASAERSGPSGRAPMLMPQDNSARESRVRLLDERSQLLSTRPGIGWSVASIILGSIGSIACVIGLATGGAGWVVFYGIFLVVGIVDLVVGLVTLGVNVGARSRIDNRVREIDHELGILSRNIHAPNPQFLDRNPGFVAYRF